MMQGSFSFSRFSFPAAFVACLSRSRIHQFDGLAQTSNGKSEVAKLDGDVRLIADEYSKTHTHRSIFLHCFLETDESSYCHTKKYVLDNIWKTCVGAELVGSYGTILVSCMFSENLTYFIIL